MGRHHPEVIVSALQDEIAALRAKAAEVVVKHQSDVQDWERQADEAQARFDDQVAAERTKIEDEMAAVLREITDQLHAGIVDPTSAAPAIPGAEAAPPAPEAPAETPSSAPEPTPAPESAPAPSWPTA
jgi:hypothetical protein